MGSVIVTAHRAVLGLAEGQSAEVELTDFIRKHVEAGLLRLAQDVPVDELPVQVLHNPPDVDQDEGQVEGLDEDEPA